MLHVVVKLSGLSYLWGEAGAGGAEGGSVAAGPAWQQRSGPAAARAEAPGRAR